MLGQLFRALACLFLGALMIGFGVCGVMGMGNGLLTGFRDPANWSGAGIFIGCGLVGILIALGCWKAIAAVWNEQPPADTPLDQ